MTRDDLIAFEAFIAEEFNAGKIPYPVHLSDGNEDQIIEVFEKIRANDWVLGSWRSHYLCLLKGVPPETLKEAIREGKSISLCFPQHRVLCSAIVGGVVPMAVGLGLAIKRRDLDERVWCFVGDMTAETGIVHESMKYARNHDLPVYWVIEDNGLSVCTDSSMAWGGLTDWNGPGIVRYVYSSKWPHCGAGVRVQF